MAGPPSRDRKVLDERASSEKSATSLVIYPDCEFALVRFRKDGYRRDKAVRWSFAQSIILQKLAVEVELHWVTGHRNVLGKEPADLVAKAARKRGLADETSRMCLL